VSPAASSTENYQSGLQQEIAGNSAEAARLYKLAADQGNAYGQVNLGRFYEYGKGGLPKDDTQAARLYKLAADQGNAYAQSRLPLLKQRP
jgi:TPR repeat protein